MMPMEDRKKCAVYARMARCDDPAEMDAQVDALVKLASESGFEVSRVCSEVAPGCGTHETSPVLKGLIDEVKRGAYDAVAIRDVTRFGRCAGSQLDLVIDALALSGTAVITPFRAYSPWIEGDAMMLGHRPWRRNNLPISKVN